MADSNDIRDEFSPLLDDELSPDARDAVEAELAQDADLLRELDAIRKIDELYRGLSRASAPADMAARVRDQLHPKPKVIPLRTRKISRTLYTSLAAAAMFSVLIGGVVIRQEFVVSPSAEERIAALAPDVADREQTFAESTIDKVTAGEASKKEAAGAFDDAAQLIEGDNSSIPPGRRADLGMLRDDAAQSESRFRQESFENAPVAEPETPALVGGLMKQQSKDEVITKSQELAAALPPPPRATPAPSEGATLGRTIGKTGEEAAEMVVAADADVADLPLAVEAQSRSAMKRANAVERIANRDFDEREDGWYQRGYNGEPTQVVRLGSETLSTLSAAIPGLKDVLALKGAIVFQHDETWYRVPSTVVGQF